MKPLKRKQMYQKLISPLNSQRLRVQGKNWWQTLQDWQKQPGYGVVQQDYQDIYDKAAQKINQYYWGSPSSPGLQDKVAAGAARRGVSENPAADVLKQRTGVEEANRLGQLSTDVNTQRATANEQGRINWLNSITNLSQMKPSVQWGGTTTTTQPQTDYIPSLIGAGASIIGNSMLGNTLTGLNDSNQSWFSNLMGGMPTTTQSSITGGANTNSGYNADDFSNFGKSALDYGKYVPGPQQPFVAGADAAWDLADMFF